MLAKITSGAVIGVDGLLIEVHPSPDSALCDGKQSITPEELEQLVAALQPLASACQRTIGTMAA